jgi:hypothetical protein
MLSNKFYAVQAEIYRDMRRKADQDRLVRLATVGRQAGDNVFWWALAWLGRRLVAWGKFLQERYGSASAPQPACQPARPGVAI